MLVLILALGSLAGLSFPAFAAPGDYTIDIQSPESVPVNQQFSQIVTVSCPDGGCVGITITQQLPSELQLVSVATGNDQVVKSVTGGEEFGSSITYVLNDIDSAGVKTFNVVLRNDRSKETTVSSASSWDLTLTSGGQTKTSTTKPTGSVNVSANKYATVPTGEDNRTVTYRITGSFPGGSNQADRAIGAFAGGQVTFTDVIPAGAEVLSSSVGDLVGGKWTSQNNSDGTQTWTLTGTANYQPVDAVVNSATLVVYYPESTFPDKTRPPRNDVTMVAKDRSGKASAPSTRGIQGPEINDGNNAPGPRLAVTKIRTSGGGHLSNAQENTYRVTGVAFDSSGEGVRNYVLADSESELFWKHTNLQALDFTFNDPMKSAHLQYRLELRYSGGGKADEWVTARSGNTGSNFSVWPRVAGSNTSDSRAVFREEGRYVSGWRLVVSPNDTDKAVPPGASASVNMRFDYMYRENGTGVEPTGKLALENTATLDAKAVNPKYSPQQASASDTQEIIDTVFTPVTLTLPSTLTVGRDGQKATVKIESRDDRDVDACVATVLPKGVHWSGDEVTVSSAHVPPGKTQPLIQQVRTESTAGDLEIVTVCFNQDFPAVKTSTGPTGYASDVTFEIPLEVLPSAYAPPASSAAKFESFALVSEPAQVPAVGTARELFEDIYNLDPNRKRVNGHVAQTSVVSEGGLQLQKDVSLAQNNGWGLLREVDGGETATWRIQVFNRLPNPASDVSVCDALPTVGDDRGSDFSLTLAEPVEVTPTGATVEYAVVNADGCADTTANWGEYSGEANAFRVKMPSLGVDQQIQVLARTKVPSKGGFEDVAVNAAIAEATVSGNHYTDLKSNLAKLSFAAAPAMSIVKKTNGQVYDAAPGASVETGSEVSWEYVVTNTGNTDLDRLNLEDRYQDGDGESGVLNPASDETGKLSPGQSRIFTAKGQAVAGQYENTATVSASAINAAGQSVGVNPEPVSAKSWYFAGSNAVSVVKLTNGKDVESAPGVYVKPDSDVEWTYRVTNSGDFDLHDVSVKDQDSEGTLVFSQTIAELKAGQTKELKATGTAKLGQYENTVVVSAKDSLNPSRTVESRDTSWYYGAEPAMTVVKKTNGVEYDAAPGAIVATDAEVEWTYTVTNTGNVPLGDFTIEDTYTSGDGSTGTLTPTSEETGPLTPGQTRTFTAKAKAIEGQYHNVATVNAEAVDAEGKTVGMAAEEVSDESWYLAGKTGLTVEKLTNGEDVTSAPGPFLAPSSEVTWTYKVTNTGTLDLTNVEVLDHDSEENQVFKDTIAELKAGESVELKAAGKAVAGQYENTVRVTVKDPLSDELLQAADTSWYFGSQPAITLEKQVAASAQGEFTDSVTVGEGESAWWQLTVSNTGNVGLGEVVITDERLDEDLTVGDLPAGESRTIVLKQSNLTEGYTNTATVTGKSPTGPVTASDSAKVDIAAKPAPTDSPTPSETSSSSPEPSASTTTGEPAPQDEPSSQPGSQDSDKLANTGAQLAGGLAAAATVLILGGGVLLLMRRRIAHK